MVPSLSLIGSSATLAASAAVAAKGVPRWDRSLFVRVNQLPGALQYPLWAPMQVGSLGGAVGIGVLVGWKRDRRLGTEIVVAGVAAWLAAKVIKTAIARERPAEAVESTELRLGAADSGLGFPSGHAALATTTAALVARRSHSRRALGLEAIPALVGFSRVHVGAHYPLDVIGGWALGVVVADTVASVIEAVVGEASQTSATGESTSGVG
ncbi:MAG: phosphatase PAP2 family protein [Acidimicrobiia bacterium]